MGQELLIPKTKKFIKRKKDFDLFVLISFEIKIAFDNRIIIKWAKTNIRGMF